MKKNKQKHKTNPSKTERKISQPGILVGYLLNHPLIFTVMMAVAVVLSFYVYGQIEISDRSLISLSVVPLTAGLIVQGRLIMGSWRKVISTVLIAYAFSFIAFIPWDLDAVYTIEGRIETWPTFFILIFILYTMTVYEKQIVIHLNEGITLLQTLAVIYWLFDYGFLTSENNYIRLALAGALILSCFSLFHAFIDFTHTNVTRFILSFWNSVIMLLFAVESFYAIQHLSMEDASGWESLVVALQYFLFGISVVYALQNFFMVYDFINKDTDKSWKQLASEHIERYSEIQVLRPHALFCAAFCILVFTLNFIYDLLPRNIMIWLVIFCFPFILFFFELLFPKKIR